jgi:DNA-binding transcriptional ArsR family regulator
MTDIGFIAPDREFDVQFQVAPVYNVLATICMFNQPHLDSISDWIDRTAALLPGNLLEQAELGCRALSYVDSGLEPFPDWLAALGHRDPEELVDIDLDHVMAKARRQLRPEAVPSREEVRGSQKTHRELVLKLHEAKGMEADEQDIERMFATFRDPVAYHRRLVSYLELMWNDYVADEWERVRPMVEDSVHAFGTVDIPMSSAEEAAKRVTQRESLPEDWREELRTVRRVVFIPSVHIGPYMLSLPRVGDTFRIVVTARIPEGSSVRSRRLERSELLTRLAALSDETRMQILELVADRGELTSSDVMEELGLTQSSASRHLTQLAATGLLAKDASQKTKVYRLGSKRIDEVLASIRGMLNMEGRDG